MRDTVILGEDGFLGPYDSIFVTDNTQSMWWDPALTDIQLTLSLWISDMENLEHCHYVFTGNTKPHKLNRNELIDYLQSSGVIGKGSKSDIDSKEKNLNRSGRK